MTMTLQERINQLLEARRLLHKQENGEAVTTTDIVLAQDLIDIVIDDMIDERFRRFRKENIK